MAACQTSARPQLRRSCNAVVAALAIADASATIAPVVAHVSRMIATIIGLPCMDIPCHITSVPMGQKRELSLSGSLDRNGNYLEVRTIFVPHVMATPRQVGQGSAGPGRAGRAGGPG